MESLNRKRIRSVENDGKQRKFFINQKMVDKNDSKIMEKIYEKTLSLMFKASQNRNKKIDDNANEVSIDGEEKLDTVDDKPVKLIGCKYCLNEIDPVISNICRNCNLNACSRCNTSCIYCSAVLCVNCVNLFGCSLDDGDNITPICEDCKKFL